MKIIAVRMYDNDSSISDVRLEDGSEVSITQAIEMFKRGELDDVYHVGVARNGTEFLATDRDSYGLDHTNLKSLPQF